ncbi:hypothetical protein ALC53_00187 [Atta colombica]|uniref:Uncharacterized protein n=1 Tax=Atta colombica TaxID=520822 RepID=A0A195BZ95_9HYME|nr:hypothetical protein ALC53_00187 [Atta colombica]
MEQRTVIKFNAKLDKSASEFRLMQQVSWSLLHDNTLSHNSLIIRQPFLTRSPCDFSLFPKLKLKLKGCFFEDIPTIQTASIWVLEVIPQNELDHAFESLLNRCNKCIEAIEDYFE